MADQAEALRRIIQQKRLKQKKDTKVVAVLSGKGGVGKSIFSVNFALGLQQAGKRTLIIDLDIGLGNIDIILGLHCQYNIVDMIDGQLNINKVISQHESGLSVLTGGNGLIHFFQLNDDKFNYFLDQLYSLSDNYDVIIFDLGAGMNNDMLRFVKAVHDIILVTTTEPTALTDAYAVVKIVHRHADAIPIHCVINRYDSEKEARETWAKLSRVSEQFLAKRLQLLGSLPRDHAVVKAVKSQQPFLISAPRSKISMTISRLVASYLEEAPTQHVTNMDSFISKLKRFLR